MLRLRCGLYRLPVLFTILYQVISGTITKYLAQLHFSGKMLLLTNFAWIFQIIKLILILGQARLGKGQLCPTQDPSKVHYQKHSLFPSYSRTNFYTKTAKTQLQPLQTPTQKHTNTLKEFVILQCHISKYLLKICNNLFHLNSTILIYILVLGRIFDLKNKLSDIWAGVRLNI